MVRVDHPASDETDDLGPSCQTRDLLLTKRDDKGPQCWELMKINIGGVWLKGRRKICQWEAPSADLKGSRASVPLQSSYLDRQGTLKLSAKPMGW